MRCLERLGHHVSAADNSMLMVAKWMDGRGNRYRMAFGMAKYVLKNRARLSNTDLIIFYGAECFLALWCLKHLIRFKGKTILHSNGIEMQVDSALMESAAKVNRYSHFFQWNMQPLFKYAYRAVDALITVSEYDAEYARNALYLNPSRIFVIEPGLSSAFHLEMKSDVQRKPVITFCGSWIERKGISVLEKVIPAILEKFPDYSFRLIGVGEHFDKQIYFTESLHHRIEIFPFVKDKSKLASLFSEAEIFLFPSLSESFGLVVAEAMASGCAVISGPTGFAWSLDHLKEIWKLNEITTEQVFMAISELIANPHLRENLSIGGIKRTRNLNWNIFEDELRNVLGSMIIDKPKASIF